MTSLFARSSVREASEYFRRPGPSVPPAMRIVHPTRPPSMSLLSPPRILQRPMRTSRFVSQVLS